jgi:hypothetical protein
LPALHTSHPKGTSGAESQVQPSEMSALVFPPTFHFLSDRRHRRTAMAMHLSTPSIFACTCGDVGIKRGDCGAWSLRSRLGFRFLTSLRSTITTTPNITRPRHPSRLWQIYHGENIFRRDQALHPLAPQHAPWTRGT